MKRRPFSRVPLNSPRNTNKKSPGSSSRSNNGSHEIVTEGTKAIDRKSAFVAVNTKMEHQGDGDFSASQAVPVCKNKSPQIEHQSEAATGILPVDYSTRTRCQDQSVTECSRDSFHGSDHDIGTSNVQVKGSVSDPRSSQPAMFDESSCSMDGHMIRMSLYGTDKDPTYQEEIARSSISDNGSDDSKVGVAGLVEGHVQGQASHHQDQGLHAQGHVGHYQGHEGHHQGQVLHAHGQEGDVQGHEGHHQGQVLHAHGQEGDVQGHEGQHQGQVLHAHGQGGHVQGDAGHHQCHVLHANCHGGHVQDQEGQDHEGHQQGHGGHHEGKKRQMQGHHQVQGQVMLQDHALSADQLASEMVQKYAASNPELLTEILGNTGGENYVCEGFEKIQHQSQVPGQYEDYQTRHMVHDVDLLNTPPQLPPDCLSNDSHRHLTPSGIPRGLTTSNSLRQTPLQSPQVLHGSVTYNDVHIHGGKWSSGHPQYQDITERSDMVHMYPYENQPNYVKGQHQPPLVQYPQGNGSHGGSYQSSRLWRPFTGAEQGQNNFRQTFTSPSQLPVGQYKSPQNLRNPGLGRQDDDMACLGLVSMTFTPRTVMASHLSSHKPGQSGPSQPIPDTQYSTIYPSQIEEPTLQSRSVRRSKPSPQDESLPPKKRMRQSKFNDIRPRRPDLPMFEHMMDKLPPNMPAEPDMLGSRHKYFVVNPSDVEAMSSKMLMNKYLDFLIVENEHITEISKSMAPPVDIYVTEDMYFMDSLKYSVPFPSKKFLDWVTSFYPKLNLPNMKFKGRHLNLKEPARMIDERPTQKILEDTFYYFQRELMNLVKTE